MSGLPDARTVTLLRVGVAAALVFVVVLSLEGALRPDYDPIYHTGSALSLGDRGWIQIANFPPARRRDARVRRRRTTEARRPGRGPPCSPSSNTGLVQRGLIVVYLGWVALLGLRLARHPRARPAPAVTPRPPTA